MRYAISTNDGTGKPVTGATISFARGGVVFNAVDFPDATGVLYFDSVADSDLFQPDVIIRVDAAGYNSAGTTGNAIHGDWVFTLRSNGLEKAALVGGALVGLLILGYSASGKRKRIAGIDVKKDVLPWLPVVGLIGGAYFLYSQFFAPSQEDKKRQEALTKDIAAAEANQPSRMSDSEIATAANAIKEDLGYTYVSNNFDDAAHQLTKPGTTADMLRLIQAYGTHYITVFGIPRGTFTLEETVTSQLPKTYIDEINAYYQAQGIDFQF